MAKTLKLARYRIVTLLSPLSLTLNCIESLGDGISDYSGRTALDLSINVLCHMSLLTKNFLSDGAITSQDDQVLQQSRDVLEFFTEWHKAAELNSRNFLYKEVFEDLIYPVKGCCSGSNTNPTAKILTLSLMTCERQRSSKRNAASNTAVGGAYPYKVLAKKSFNKTAKLGLVEERQFYVNKNCIEQCVNISDVKVETRLPTFTYVIVIDFESTCWGKGEQSHPNEIIEFPAILVDVEKRKEISRFHHYVQPMEQPKLSEFCTTFTGITQEQVEESLPLDIVLSKFKKWLNVVSTEHSFKYNCGEGTLCTFVTWTNWDLGICLAGELKRKAITFPEQLTNWIDLKALYKKFYDRPPKGLRVSMNEVGLQFLGREHSGIIDSENTVRLLQKMVSDGCALTLTKTSL